MTLAHASARIMIVDDNELARLLLKRILEKEGLEVCAEARDGQEALAIVRQARPDLIILDFMMPLKDGLQTAREILELRPSVRIVLNTLYITEQLRAVAEKIGVKRVVAKSDLHLLRNALYAVLDAEDDGSPN
jgi:CheY-like chemotaxis protein